MKIYPGSINIKLTSPIPTFSLLGPNIVNGATMTSSCEFKPTPLPSLHSPSFPSPQLVCMPSEQYGGARDIIMRQCVLSTTSSTDTPGATVTHHSINGYAWRTTNAEKLDQHLIEFLTNKRLRDAWNLMDDQIVTVTFQSW
jgi:hypothetical protein